jgi:pimeloyl-ACP methyl ester carboxylesterase
MTEQLQSGSAISADGTRISYLSVGNGPGLVLVGGVLSSASTYLPLAEGLAGEFTVHVMNRRGRPPSGPQRPRHNIDDECADLAAVASATPLAPAPLGEGATVAAATTLPLSSRAATPSA